jgi:hypothetical protein
MNCKEIIKTYLVQHSYDGLYTEDCGCFLSDLFPCGECFENCRPGIMSTIEQQFPTIEEMSGSIYENGLYLAQSLNDKAFAYKGLHGWSVVFDDNSGELGMSDERFFKQRGFRIIRKIDMEKPEQQLPTIKEEGK